MQSLNGNEVDAIYRTHQAIKDAERVDGYIPSDLALNLLFPQKARLLGQRSPKSPRWSWTGTYVDLPKLLHNIR